MYRTWGGHALDDGRDTVELELSAAAARLGLTVEATRKRVRRGSLPARKGDDGRWYVRVAIQDTSGTAQDAVQDNGPDNAVTGILAAQVAFLQSQLEERNRAEAELRQLLSREQSLHLETKAELNAVRQQLPAPVEENVRSNAQPRRWWRWW